MTKRLVGKSGPKVVGSIQERHGHKTREKVVNLIMRDNNSQLMSNEEFDQIKELFRKRGIYDERFGPSLVDYMSSGNSYHSFAGAIGVSVNVLKKWEEAEPEWIVWRDRGFAAALLFWEDRLNRAATKVEQADAKLMIFKLKNMFPEDYKEKVEVSGEMAPTSIIIKGLSDLGLGHSGEEEEDDIIEEVDYTEIPNNNEIDLEKDI